MIATEGDAILQAIIDDHADNVSRLVYADWLEDHGGEAAHARFIRQQVREGGELLWDLHDPAPWRGGIIVQPKPDKPHRLWRGGFIARVRCPLQFWLAHGRWLAKRHPCQRVELTDRRPWVLTTVFSRPPSEWDAQWPVANDKGDWWDLPTDIHAELPRSYFPFDEFSDAVTPEDAAIDAASVALLAWAIKPDGKPLNRAAP